MVDFVPIAWQLLTAAALLAVMDAAEETVIWNNHVNSTLPRWMFGLASAPLYIDFYHFNQGVKQLLSLYVGVLISAWISEGGRLNWLEAVASWYLWYEWRNIWYHAIFKRKGRRQLPLFRIPLLILFPRLKDWRF